MEPSLRGILQGPRQEDRRSFAILPASRYTVQSDYSEPKSHYARTRSSRPISNSAAHKPEKGP
jgi:hypothetical protein